MIPDTLKDIVQYLQRHGATPLLVGGAVRDMMRGIASPKDFDIEVYGLANLDELAALLGRFGRVHEVGKSFGVLKLHLHNEEFDFSFPRTEIKTDKGHRGFVVVPDGSLSFEEAAKRRDFTINAIGYDPIDGAVYDPYNGLTDLQYGILRHVDERTFVEDPLRVYRAVQFAARFEMEIAPQTDKLCRRMVQEGMLDELPKERVYEEFKKLLLKARRPSIGFALMRKWGITQRYFPELHALINVPQDARYHPEGDVWVHTMMTVDAMARLLRDDTGLLQKNSKDALVLMAAALCHDFGKPETTTLQLDDNVYVPWKQATPQQYAKAQRIRALGHEQAGLQPTRRFIRRLTNEKTLLSRILPLVEHHLKPSQLYQGKAKDAAVRRLSLKVPISDVVLVAKADFLGRTTLEAKAGRFEAGEWLLARAEALQIKHTRPKPLLTGHDLIALGLSPSPLFSSVLQDVYERQLDGAIRTKTEALAYAKELVLSKNKTKSQ